MADENAENVAELGKSSSKYGKQVEKYLSQYLQQENQLLYQKEEYNRLNDYYSIMRFDLYNQKRSTGKLRKDYDQIKENLIEKEKLRKN
ncbi:MAG: hypothetical protein NKF70_01925 [Methanobacterium sp. ERen5]|nr:MAG: hypothetical protein NKF70_01925 [Methanobacterium sp. ERen5]